MKFMLMMNAPKGDGDWNVAHWRPEDVKAMIGFMKRFNEELKNTGVLVGAEGLTPPSQAKRVRAGADGAPITDGVFPEAKEFLAGYWIVDVDTADRAYAIAAQASAAPGPGGKPMNMDIEVRQIGSPPPADLP